MTKLILPLVLLVAACSPSTSKEAEANPAALVVVTRAELGSIPRTITVFGAADAGASAASDLVAPVEATLVSVAAPVGSRVAAGQVVARLNPSPGVRLDISKAAAEARSTSDAYARARRLRADGLNSDAEVEAARAAAASASATLSSLTRRAREMTLVAPASGTVTSLGASPGAMVQPGSVVATVTAGAGLRGRFGVDPATARAIGPGAYVRVAPASGGPPFSVRITSVDPVVDPQTRLASLYVTLPPQARIGAGEPLRGEIVAGGGGEGVVVPYSALLDDGGQPFVYVVQKGVARRRNVAVGASDAKRASITSGVAAGEIIVTQGGTALEDGIKVRTR